MNNTEVIVIGYPKSGNTLTARLLGDALNSPVMGFKSALPLATEGDHRKGKYVVRQLHLKPMYGECPQFLLDPWYAGVNAWDGERLAFVYRDPRDVAVSVMHYWDLPDIQTALDCMVYGKKPLDRIGPWSEYIRSWKAVKGIHMEWVSFESLIRDKSYALYRLLYHLSLADEYSPKLAEVWERQSIENKRAQIEVDGETRPYGKAIQLKNLRKGIVGDWKNHFNASQMIFAETHFGEVMNDLGYPELEK